MSCESYSQRVIAQKFQMSKFIVKRDIFLQEIGAGKSTALYQQNDTRCVVITDVIKFVQTNRETQGSVLLQVCCLMRNLFVLLVPFLQRTKGYASPC
jgi:hypothetical protein